MMLESQITPVNQSKDKVPTSNLISDQKPRSKPKIEAKHRSEIDSKEREKKRGKKL